MSPLHDAADSRIAGCLAAALALLLPACGGGGSPAAPGTPPPTTVPAETFAVSALLYYDENRNNLLEERETVRLADVEVEVGGRTARTGRDGRVSVQGVPRGSHGVVIRSATLPPFFVGGAPVTIEAPQPNEARVPVALPIGTNRPFTYLCSGDSISQGNGSRDGRGYRAIMEAKLEAYYDGAVTTTYRGGGGGSSAEGAARILRDLLQNEPAYTLIAWGTNDWVECGDDVAGCFTIANLRSIVREVKAFESLPCLATLIPVNAGFDDRVPPRRNEWVSRTNEQIRALAREEGALLVDLHAAFQRSADPSSLFSDHVHPNDDGYDVIATAFFEALTRPRGSGSAAGASGPAPAFGFAPHPAR